jgi:glucosamine-6-phosphate deaminase
MALTVGVQTVLDAREVVVVVTGQRKALAIAKAIGVSFPATHVDPMLIHASEEGVNHLVSLSPAIP